LYCRIRLIAVSRRAKLMLLGVVLAAILYVLISPLPELAATSTLKFPVFPLILIVFILLSPTNSFGLTGLFGDASRPECNILLARTCVRLC
jgi:hypothetical protein